MPLSCECETDYDPASGYYAFEEGNWMVQSVGRRKRCNSCKSLVQFGEEYFGVRRWKQDEFEENEIELAPEPLCERCANIALSLAELGFCINYTDDMDDALKEYHEFVAEENEWKAEKKLKEEKKLYN